MWIAGEKNYRQLQMPGRIKRAKCRDQDKQNTKHIKTKVRKGKGKG